MLACALGKPVRQSVAALQDASLVHQSRGLSRGATTICSRSRLVDIQSVVGVLTGTYTIDLIRGGMHSSKCAEPDRSCSLGCGGAVALWKFGKVAGAGGRGASRVRIARRHRSRFARPHNRGRGRGRERGRSDRRQTGQYDHEAQVNGNPRFRLWCQPDSSRTTGSSRFLTAQVNRDRENLSTTSK